MEVVMFKSKWFGYFLIIFGFLFIACKTGTNSDSNSNPVHTHEWGEWTETKEPTYTEDGEEERICKLDPSHAETRPIPSLVAAYLNTQNGGNTADDPIPLSVNMGLGDMMEDTTGWKQLLDIIAQADKFVNLDLSACTMDGTVFNPDTTITTGKNKNVTIAFPDTAESIAGLYPVSSFGYSSVLKSFSGVGLTTIGSSVFYGCHGLNMSSLPEKITTIDAYAFNGTGIEDIMLPEGLISIGMGAFSSCANLRRITLPESLTNAGYYNFASCPNLEEITMSANLTSIYNSNFRGSTSLVSFILTGTGSLSTIFDGKALVLNGAVLIAYPSVTGSIILPSGITEIGEDAFSGCTGLAEITLPESVIRIRGGNYGSFSGCTNLIKVTLGTISESAWHNPQILGGGGTFPGNLREVYFDVGGGAGTYNTSNPGNNPTWIKQP
jgi:hypothetical protein